MTQRVGIYVYGEAEVLDFAGPYEVFSTARRVSVRAHPQAAPPFDVCLVAESKGIVKGRAAFAVQPHFTIDDHPALDILIVPGGAHAGELAKARVVKWIAGQHTRTRLTASVCTGAFLLAGAGVLAGLEVTTHWEDCADLVHQFPDLRVRERVRWTEHERVMTSAGISSGIDMCLRIVARFAGQDLAERTARQMDYDWRKRWSGPPLARMLGEANLDPGSNGRSTGMEEIEKERQRVEAEERELVFESFSNDDALELGLLMVEKARSRSLPIAIDIDRSGQRLFHFAAAGTSPDNGAWIERKKNLVKRVFHSSYAVGLKLGSQGKTLADSMEVGTESFAAHGGCFPVVVRNVGFVGTVTISGLPQKDDHDFAVESIREFLGGKRAARGLRGQP
jgi:uncharacterized protein (UPF0303 family)/putative intracellular protease/amidase